MGKTPSPGKWIKSLLGKKSSKSSLDKGTDKLRSAKKEELVVKVKDTNNNNVSDLPTNPSPLVSLQEVAATQTLLVPDVVVVPEKQPSEGGDTEGDEPNANDTEELKLEEDATKVSSLKACEEFPTLKGVVKLQAVVRGHLVRRQAVATYSCVWGIVKFQALVRGKIARSSVQLQKTDPGTETSETQQGSRYSWLEGSTKLSMIDKILVSSPTVLPLRIPYGSEDPNSAKVWLERWTELQVWAPGPLVVVKSLVPKTQTKKRSFQAVEPDKGKLKRGVKKPPGGLNTGSGSTADNDKPKRSVRKAASTLGKEVSRKSTSAIKEGSSSLEAKKEEKPRVSLRKASVSNGVEKPTRRSAEKKKKDIVDSVQREVSGDKKVSASVVDTPEEEEEVKDSSETVSKDEKQDELKTDKAEEEIQEPDVEISSENGTVDTSENTKQQSDRRASLPGKIESHHQDQEDGVITTHSGRKIPSYMAPTASTKARVRGGQGSTRLDQEKPNGTTRRHSLPTPANGKLSAMSPRAHRLLVASAKGSSMNSDRSFSSSKDIGDKSTKAEWKR